MPIVRRQWAVLVVLMVCCWFQQPPTLAQGYGHEDLIDGIYLVEPFQKDQVLLHFNTRANTAYTLEWTSHLPGDPVSPPVWSKLYEAPVLPFPNHYIVLDTRAAAQRFYRLRIRP